MNVLHIVPTLERGGAENHLVELVRGQIQDLGWHVGVVSMFNRLYWGDYLGSLGCEVFSLDLNFYLNPLGIFRLRDVIRKFSPDLVHSHLHPAELITRLALLGFDDLPWVISKHNDEVFVSLFNKRIKLSFSDVLGRWVDKRADRVIAISSAVRDYCVKSALNIPEEKVRVIHYGIKEVELESDQERLVKLRKELGLGEEDFLVGTVMRLVPQKDPVTLLKGFCEFLNNYRDGLTVLAIIGKGPMEPYLKRLVKDLGISDKVKFLGFREDVINWMRTFDVFVLTSIYEGLGLVLLEAMAVGCPIIATSVSAIPEVLGPAGILIPPRNPSALAKALYRLSNDVEKRLFFSQKGKERVQTVFTIEKMIRATEEVYHEAVRQRR